MAHPPSSSTSPATDDKGRYKQFTGAVRQSLKNLTAEPKQQKSFWNVLAKKARSAFLDDEVSPSTPTEPEQRRTQECNTLHSQFTGSKPENWQHRAEGPSLQKGFEAITSSLSILGGTIGNAIEEGLNIVESKATDLMSSDSRHRLTKKTVVASKSKQQKDPNLTRGQLGEAVILGESSADKETQLKASRDVAMAMAAKAKLLLRELKDAKADLALAKDRCRQLEEENRRIRESFTDGAKPEEEDLVRIQLEILLAEKARLAQENSYYARENQFLREMLEYHQLTEQSGGVSLDEGLLEGVDMARELDIEEAEGCLSESPKRPS